MNILYIIGNGFDLHHEMKTSYSHFRIYLKKNNPDCFDAVEKFLILDDKWSDFEQSLASLDVELLEEEANEFLFPYSDDNWSDSYHHDYEYQLEQYVKTLSKTLLHEFYNWLNTITLPIKKRLPLSNDGLFLTFNYTDVLNKLYKIPTTQIVHIHGSLKDSVSSIVLGHNWKPCNRVPLASYADEYTDTRVSKGYGILDDYFGETYKPTQKIINNHANFFSSLRTVDCIYVYGHSLSDVDLDYFKEIIKFINPSTHWNISYYSQSDCTNIKNSLNTLGISYKKYTLFKI